MFHVCKLTSENWQLVNGVMSPQAHIGEGGLFIDRPPGVLAIWLDEVDGMIYKWQISVDCTNADTPCGQYLFKDQSGDVYTLSAEMRILHTVAYNSAQPFITQIGITLPLGHAVPDSWYSAPQCP